MIIIPDRAGVRPKVPLSGSAAGPFVSDGLKRPGRSPYDADQKKVAEALSARYPGWLVIWAPYRRCFTAIAACLAEALIIDERDPLALTTQMDLAQVGAATSAVRSRVWPPVQPPQLPVSSEVSGEWRSR